LGDILDTSEIVPDGLIVDVKRTLWQKLSKLGQDLVQRLQRALHIQSLFFELSCCVIRAMPISDSGACRSVIPAHADQ
jgi:hypothetical protein